MFAQEIIGQLQGIDKTNSKTIFSVAYLPGHNEVVTKP